MDLSHGARCSATGFLIGITSLRGTASHIAFSHPQHQILCYA